MTFLQKLFTFVLRRKRFVISVIVVFFAVSGWYLLSEYNQKPSMMKDASPMMKEKKAIETITPKLQANSNSLILLGEVMSNETAQIYARRQGIIKDIYVDVGDTVYENQVVATLLPRGVEGESAAVIAEQKARRDLASVTLEEVKDVEDDVIDAAEEKIDELKDKRDGAREARDAAIAKAEAEIAAANSASEIAVAEAERDRVTAVENAKVEALEAEIDTAKDVADAVEEQQEKIVESAEAGLSVADAALNKTVAVNGHVNIRSPFAGVIAKRNVTVGEMLGSGMSAFRLSDVPTALAKKAKNEIIFGLPEDLDNVLSVGDDIVFFAAYGDGEEYQATVTRKSPEIDEDTRDFRVHAKIIGEHNLVHQTSVRVRVVTNAQPRYEVPSKSVKRIDDENYVWIFKRGISVPERLRVTVHADDGEIADISGEITEDTRLLKRLSDKITMPMGEMDGVEMEDEMDSQMKNGEGMDASVEKNEMNDNVNL